jgi:uncharacterized protein
MDEQSRPAEPPPTPTSPWARPDTEAWVPPGDEPPHPSAVPWAPTGQPPAPFPPTDHQWHPVWAESHPPLPPPHGEPTYGSGPAPNVAGVMEGMHIHHQPPSGPWPRWPAAPGWLRFPPIPPVRWGLPDAVLALLAFLLGAVVASGAVLGIGVAATGEDPAAFAEANIGVLNIAGMMGSWGAAVGFVVAISRIKGQGSLRRDFGFSFSGWDPLIGAAAAVVTLLMSAVIQTIIATASGVEPVSNSEQIFGAVRQSWPLLIVMSLMAAIGAPIVEELLFRGLVLRSIERRFGGLVAVVGSSVLFGVLHLPGSPAPLPLLAGITVYGAVFALLTRTYGRLGPAVFAHIWLNTLATSVVLAGAI